MIGTVGLVTDSNSQLPPVLVERYGVAVVPLTVVVDGVEHREGVDLDADDFYACFAGGRTPDVATAQPSPGAFAEVYGRLIDDGATEILSIHIGSALSGTLNSARIAAEALDLPVRLVDTGTASFGIACCVWEAAEALLAGVGVAAAARRAELLAPRIGTVFVVRALDLVRKGGRLAVARPVAAGARADDEDDAVPVLTLVDGEVRVVGGAADLDAATDAMARFVADAAAALDEPAYLRVAIGTGDPGTEAISRALETRLAALDAVKDLVRYRIGPSVGAHTGPGTVGAFYFPVGYGSGSGRAVARAPTRSSTSWDRNR